MDDDERERQRAAWTPEAINRLGEALWPITWHDGPMDTKIDTYRIGWGHEHRRLAAHLGASPGSYRRTPDRWRRRWQAEAVDPALGLSARRGWTRAGARRRMARHIRRCEGGA